MAKIYENLDPENIETVKSIIKSSKEAHELMKMKMAELDDINNQLCKMVEFLFSEEEDSDE